MITQVHTIYFYFSCSRRLSIANQRNRKTMSAADWEICQAPNGAEYYYNIKTQQSVWTRPPELASQAVVARPEPAAAAPRSWATTTQFARSEQWEECRGPTGDSYFYNIKTNVSFIVCRCGCVRDAQQTKLQSHARRRCRRAPGCSQTS